MKARVPVPLVGDSAARRTGEGVRDSIAGAVSLSPVVPQHQFGSGADARNDLALRKVGHQARTPKGDFGGHVAINLGPPGNVGRPGHRPWLPGPPDRPAPGTRRRPSCAAPRAWRPRVGRGCGAVRAHRPKQIRSVPGLERLDRTPDQLRRRGARCGYDRCSARRRLERDEPEGLVWPRLDDAARGHPFAAQPPGVEDVVTGLVDLVPRPRAEGRIEAQPQRQRRGAAGVGARIDD